MEQKTKPEPELKIPGPLITYDLERAASRVREAKTQADKARLTDELLARIAGWRHDPKAAIKGALLAALLEHDNSRARAMAAIGLPARTLYYYLDQLGLQGAAEKQAKRAGLTPAQGRNGRTG